jgi:hypothetical protein
VSWLALGFAAYLVVGGALTTRTVVCGSRLTLAGWIVSVLAWPLIVAIGPEAYRRKERVPLLRGPPREWWSRTFPATDAGFHALLRDGAALAITRITVDELRLIAKPGDVMWTYSSPDLTWRALAGRAGVVVVREGSIVRNVVIVMN